MKAAPTAVLLLAASTPPAVSGERTLNDGKLPNLRWSSTGGGWRAQFACVGFANLFSQPPLDILRRFSAISTTSGASWFSAQLFYSREFYGRVARVDGQALHEFVLEWMGSYEAMLNAAIKNTTEMNAELEQSVCNLTGLPEGRGTQTLSDLCHTLVYVRGDWALFVEEMLDYAAKTYGDSDLVDRTAGRDNRIEPLADTDLLVQGALVPNSRIRESAENDTAVYIGPYGSSDIHATVLSAAYVVDNYGSMARFEYGTEGDIAAGTSAIPSEHAFSDWQDFHLWPGENGTGLISSEGHTDIAGGDIFAPAFGGGESSVVQVAAISSAAVAPYSPLAPSTFTQAFSKQRHEIEQGGRIDARLEAFDERVAWFYEQPILDGFAVCSQWPNSCGAADGMFVDGWFSDNPAFAINVGQYHVKGGDLAETLRVILTNTNEVWPTDFQHTQMLQYFESPINKGVEPGGFNWPPGMWVPYQSPQIFSEFMDAEMLDGLIEPISGSNITTAILGGTTIKNGVFGVRAGQWVEVLLINLNEPIPTYIATPDLVRLFAEPLADMTKHIAENEELARRIEAFVEPLHDDGGATEDSPSSSGHFASQGRALVLTATLSLLLFFATA